ncbi:MAG TPA: exonuclease SbcCD subunit D [Actinomycetota bacterium]|nr:exonuclease SbcCD subunit D [Actinomycetota bacterium]
MRFLHTADWHAGKRLGRVSRTAEFEAVFDELVSVAKEEKVDAVLVAGDLWDRAFPPLDAVELVVDTLIRLADVTGRVVAIRGNHDSGPLFQLLGRLLEPRGVALRHRICAPAEGGVLTIPSRDGTETARVAAFPFLHEAEVIDLMSDSAEWYKEYSDRIRLISQALCREFDPSGIGVLMAHCFIDGATVGGGERQIHMGPQYAAKAQSIPPGASYVALGHVHRPQAVEGSATVAHYAGSLLQLDFSEQTHHKQVVVVDCKPGRAVKVKPVRLAAGRRLLRVTDELENLALRAPEFGDAYLDVRVKTAGPVFGLQEQVRKFLPNALMVQAEYDLASSPAGSLPRSLERGMAELYSDYHVQAHKAAAPPELLEAVRELEEELLGAAP